MPPLVYPGLIFDSTKHLMTFMGNTTLPGSADFWDAYDEVSEDDDNVFFQGIFSDQGALEFGVRVTLCFLMAIPNMLFIDGTRAVRGAENERGLLTHRVPTRLAHP